MREAPQHPLLKHIEISTKRNSNFPSINPIKRRMSLSSHQKGGQYTRWSPAIQDCHGSAEVKGMTIQNIECCIKDMKCNVPICSTPCRIVSHTRWEWQEADTKSSNRRYLHIHTDQWQPQVSKIRTLSSLSWTPPSTLHWSKHSTDWRIQGHWLKLLGSGCLLHASQCIQHSCQQSKNCPMLYIGSKPHSINKQTVSWYNWKPPREEWSRLGCNLTCKTCSSILCTWGNYKENTIGQAFWGSSNIPVEIISQWGLMPMPLWQITKRKESQIWDATDKQQATQCAGDFCQLCRGDGHWQ